MLNAGTAASSRPLSPNLQRQLHAILTEKHARTAAQRKLDSHLLAAIQRQAGVVSALTQQRPALDVTPDGMTVVDITCPVTNDMTDVIEALGGKMISQHSAYDTLRVRLPLRALETVATRSDVRSVRPPAKRVAHRETAPISLNTSEGDVAHQADLTRAALDVDGSGVKACAVSDGVVFLRQVQRTGDLPDDIDILDGHEGIGREGTALLEIIHDLAPGATLGFAGIGSPQDMADSILGLAADGCDIIVDDIGFPTAQSPFQDDIIATAVNQVVADGVAYFSAAGNDNSLSKGTSGTWEGDFVKSDIRQRLEFSLDQPFDLHDFGDETVGNRLLVDTPLIVLWWADPLGQSAQDYDLCIVDESFENIIQCSTNIQAGESDPLEFLGPGFAGEQVVIVQTRAADRFLHMGAISGSLAMGTTGSVFGHPAAAGAISVAAVDVAQADGPFDGTEKVEDFSSDGPRRIFFSADGEPLTPGNFSSTGGRIRQKPDIAAADAVSTATPGFAVFFGTSAAAPHVAAVAALLKQIDPTLTPAQLKTALSFSAQDIETPGVDANTGFGLVDALNAARAVEAGLHRIERLNDALRLDRVRATFDPLDSRASAGVFTVIATFTNTSSQAYIDVFFRVNRLSQGQTLLTSTLDSPFGLTHQGAAQLNPGDSFETMFEIGLQEALVFDFLIDVFGLPSE